MTCITPQNSSQNDQFIKEDQNELLENFHSHYNALKHLMKIKNQEDCKRSTQGKTNASFLMLCAITIELGFRLLINKDKLKREKTHNLFELFKKLPQESMDSIRIRCGDDAEIFEGSLRKIQNLFHENRYPAIYPDSAADIVFINNLIGAIIAETNGQPAMQRFVFEAFAYSALLTFDIKSEAVDAAPIAKNSEQIPEHYRQYGIAYISTLVCELGLKCILSSIPSIKVQRTHDLLTLCGMLGPNLRKALRLCESDFSSKERTVLECIEQNKDMHIYLRYPTSLSQISLNSESLAALALHIGYRVENPDIIRYAYILDENLDEVNLDFR